MALVAMPVTRMPPISYSPGASSNDRIAADSLTPRVPGVDPAAHRDHFSSLFAEGETAFRRARIGDHDPVAAFQPEAVTTQVRYLDWHRDIVPPPIPTGEIWLDGLSN
jgi:hypothetical protein